MEIPLYAPLPTVGRGWRGFAEGVELEALKRTAREAKHLRETRGSSWVKAGNMESKEFRDVGPSLAM